MLWGAGYYGGAHSMAMIMPNPAVEHHHDNERLHPHEEGKEEHDEVEELEMDDLHEKKDPDHGH